MNKNLESWHAFYSNKQRKRDVDRTELTFLRAFKKLLWDTFESSNLLAISYVTESMGNLIYLESDSGASIIAIHLIPERKLVQVKHLLREDEVDFSSTDEQSLEKAIVSIAKLFMDRVTTCKN